MTEITKRPRADMRELGVTGLKRASGYVFEEYLRELQGATWRKTIAEMSYHPVVGSFLFAIDMLIRRVKWTVKPHEEGGQADPRVEFLNKAINGMRQPWNEKVSEILTMIPYGWSMQEIVYQRNADGSVGWKDFAIRGQDSLLHWEFADNGDILGMYQSAPPLYQRVFLPIDKCLLFRTSSRKNNPEGVSVLRSAYRPWYIGKNVENIQAIGAERIYNGIPVAWVPPELFDDEASDAEKAILAMWKSIVTSLRADEMQGLVLPRSFTEDGTPEYELQLLSPNGTQQIDTEQIIQRNNQMIAMSVLADFVLLGHENVGSFSLSESKSNLFVTAIDAWLESIADVVNRYAIPKLLYLNGMSVDNPPKLSHGEITRISIEELGAYLTQLNAIGMPLFPDEALDKYLREQGDLPPASGTAISTQDKMLLAEQAAQAQAQKANKEKQQEQPKRATEEPVFVAPVKNTQMAAAVERLRLALGRVNE